LATFSVCLTTFSVSLTTFVVSLATTIASCCICLVSIVAEASTSIPTKAATSPLTPIVNLLSVKVAFPPPPISK